MVADKDFIQLERQLSYRLAIEGYIGVNRVAIHHN